MPGPAAPSRCFDNAALKGPLPRSRRWHRVRCAIAAFALLNHKARRLEAGLPYLVRIPTRLMAYPRGWNITQFSEFLIRSRRHPVKSGKFFCCVSFHLFPNSRDLQASVRQDTYVRTRYDRRTRTFSRAKPNQL